MLGPTDREGKVVSVTHFQARGPYIDGPPRLGVGANAGANGNKMQFSFNAALVADDATPVGWLYNPNSGKIIANSEASDARGKPYQAY